MSSSELNAPAAKAMAAACIASLFGALPLVSMFPLVLPAIAKELGVGRGQVSLLVTVFILANAVATPILGGLADRKGARPVAIAVVLALGLAALALSQAPASPALTYALVAAMGALCPMIVINSRLIAGWFARRRGVAIMVMGLILGLMNTCLLQLNRRLLEGFSWRAIYLNYGAIAILIAIPIMLLFYREHDQGRPRSFIHYGVEARVARRDPVFWLLVAATVLNVSVVLGIQPHMVALLGDNGIDRAMAVNFISLGGVGILMLDPLNGWLLDRFQTPRVVIPYLVAGFAGLLLLAFGKTPPVLGLGVFLLIAGSNSELGMMPYMLSRYFGLRSFSELYGTYYLIGGVGMSMAPLAMGYSFDLLGGYRPALFLFLGMLTLAMVCLLNLPGYRFDAKPTDTATSSD